MKIKCIANSKSDLPENYMDLKEWFDPSDEFSITTGKTYNVYGISFKINLLLYCICDDDYEAKHGLYYPTFWPAPLFKVEDARLSNYWRFAITPNHRDHLAIISYAEWVDDPYYYDHLTDMREQEVLEFLQYKKLIDIEVIS